MGWRQRHPMQVQLHLSPYLFPPLFQQAFLGHSPFNEHLPAQHSHSDAVNSFLILSYKAISKISSFGLYCSQICFQIVISKIGEHIVDIAYTHIYCDHRRPEFAIPNAGRCLQVVFEVAFEVQRQRAGTAEMAKELKRSIGRLRVECEEVGHYFSACEAEGMRGQLEPESFGSVREGLKGGEEVLDELVVEADVMVPTGGEEEGQRRAPVSVVLAAQHHLHHHLLFPKLGSHRDIIIKPSQTQQCPE